MSEVARVEGLKSGTFKSTMETIYPRLSLSLSLVTVRSPLGSVRKVAGKGLKSGSLMRSLHWCPCEPDYFSGKRKAEERPPPNGLIFFQ